MTEHAQIASSANTRPVFSVNASYLISPASSQADVQNDASMLLEGVIGTLDVLANGLFDESSDMAANPAQTATVLFSLWTQLRMVKGLVDAIEVRR